MVRGSAVYRVSYVCKGHVDVSMKFDEYNLSDETVSS